MAEPGSDLRPVARAERRARQRDNQQRIPVRRDYAFRPDTWDSIELDVTHTVPEWDNMAVRFALEEDAVLLPAGQWDGIAPRQTEFHLIRP